VPSGSIRAWPACNSDPALGSVPSFKAERGSPGLLHGVDKRPDFGDSISMIGPKIACGFHTLDASLCASGAGAMRVLNRQCLTTAPGMTKNRGQEMCDRKPRRRAAELTGMTETGKEAERGRRQPQSIDY
jgi:hypothetical protein